MFPWGSYEPEPDRNMRMVVFGSPDIVGNVHDSYSKRKAWTEELCDEVRPKTPVSHSWLTHE
jgi:hypothetical protein